jgi:hypothetical protein
VLGCGKVQEPAASDDADDDAEAELQVVRELLGILGEPTSEDGADVTRAGHQAMVNAVYYVVLDWPEYRAAYERLPGVSSPLCLHATIAFTHRDIHTQRKDASTLFSGAVEAGADAGIDGL